MSGTEEVAWFLVVVLACGAFWVFASLGFGWQRRAHFGVRVTLMVLVPLCLLVPSSAGYEAGLLTQDTAVRIALLLLMACLPALILVPRVLYVRAESSRGDDGDGGDPVRDGPLSPPGLPGGGLPLPLPDAEQGRWRVRNRERPAPAVRRVRRPGREPGVRPTRRTRGTFRG
jgi:hypothetical protein